MAVEIQVGSSFWEVGSGSLLHAFASTVSARLEPQGWGSRFPLLLLRLYDGELPAADAAAARAELVTVRRELGALAPDQVVWDIEDRAARPPWGDDINPDITSLADYFVTSDGHDLFDVLDLALAAAQEGAEPVRVA